MDGAHGRELGLVGGIKLPSRFFEKVEKTPTCWLWSGARSKGYGVFGIPKTRRNARAHRLSYLFHVGPIPIGLELDHLCRVPACVNPAHLEPVTHQINTARGVAGQATGRQMRSRTHCPSGHPYDKKNTRIRPNGSRVCMACHVVAKRRRRDARRAKGLKVT